MYIGSRAWLIVLAGDIQIIIVTKEFILMNNLGMSGVAAPSHNKCYAYKQASDAQTKTMVA